MTLYLFDPCTGLYLKEKSRACADLLFGGIERIDYGVANSWQHSHDMILYYQYITYHRPFPIFWKAQRKCQITLFGISPACA